MTQVESVPGNADERCGPLAGVRILELGNFIAAPSAGRMLAEFGAEVIKVEQPGVGDQVRRWRLFRGETSMMWRTLARNKKSVTIDLHTAEGQELVRRLAGRADAVVENYRPGKLESWGLGPEQLRRDNPKLVVVRISGYGQTGPYRDRAGFGGVAEALGGLRFLTGHPDRSPTRVGVSLGDQLAGLHAVIGTLMGLWAREHASRELGETVDVALHEAVFSVMEGLIPEYTAYGVVRERSGNEIPGVAPSNTYPCLHGEWVVIGGNADTLFQRLMTGIGRPDLAVDGRFRDNRGRARHSRLLDAAIAEFTYTRTLAEVMAVMVAAEVPAGPIYSAAEMAADPHFRARDMLLDIEVAVDGAAEEVLFPGVVPKLAQQPGRVRWLGPELGEHTADVLTGLLDLSNDEISALRDRKVV
ncbi:MAG TPA: CoA transferase [Pseudonocardia sp.]|nr:CoA transferase [Pseudonocardia sp.]